MGSEETMSTARPAQMLGSCWYGTATGCTGILFLVVHHWEVTKLVQVVLHIGPKRVYNHGYTKGAQMANDEDSVARDEAKTDEASRILQQALERPGVREMMSVYHQWESLCRAARPHCQTVGRQTVIALADTSEPTRLNVV